MAIIKRTKENTTIDKTLHKKLKTEQHELWCSRRGSNSYSTSDTHWVTLITKRREITKQETKRIFHEVLYINHVGIYSTTERHSVFSQAQHNDRGYKALTFTQEGMIFTSSRSLAAGGIIVRIMVVNVTFNNISVISWRLVLFVEETGIPGENHRPSASHWQTLSHYVVSSTLRLSGNSQR